MDTHHEKSPVQPDADGPGATKPDCVLEKIRIRNISWVDWRDLAGLFRQIFPELTAGEISYFIRHYEDMIRVADTDDGPIGFYQFNPKANDGTAWLNYLGVIRSCHCGGTGTRLLRDYEERAIEAGFRKAGLDVLQQNDQAIRFYEKHGYTRLHPVGGKFRYTKILMADPPATASRGQQRTRPFLARTYRRALYLLLVDLPMWCRKPRT